MEEDKRGTVSDDASSEMGGLSGVAKSIYDSTGVPTLHLCIGISLVVGSMLTRIFGFAIFGRCFTFLYLVYMTFKIQDETGEIEMKDKIYWLTYWAFYGVWTLFDTSSDFIFYYAYNEIIPYVDAAKLIFVLWCLLPQTRGAQQIYYLFIHRELQRYEMKIDQTLATVKASLSQVMMELGRMGLEFLMEFMGSMGVNGYHWLADLTGQLLIASTTRAESPQSPNSPKSPSSPLESSKVPDEI
mmetsp:Transcript_25806/g.35955  ORF Transcript_25806/g.35955 Transcript_25806/m.35955 type:complete len:242 (+) Transcript_25806:98-823(+)